MREAREVAGRETAAAVVVATSRDTVVAAADADKETAVESTKRVAVAAVVCSTEPRH